MSLWMKLMMVSLVAIPMVAQVQSPAGGVAPAQPTAQKPATDPCEAMRKKLDDWPQLGRYADANAALPATEPRVLQIRALVLGGAMDWLDDNEASTNHILGFPFTQHGLRLGVEASLRSLARVAPTQRHRYTLVDMANRVRPTSTF